MTAAWTVAEIGRDGGVVKIFHRTTGAAWDHPPDDSTFRIQTVTERSTTRRWPICVSRDGKAIRRVPEARPAVRTSPSKLGIPDG